MSPDQILLLYFGLPLAILGLGLRRALGRRILLVLLAGTLAGAYSLLLESLLGGIGHGLPFPSASGLFRSFGPYALAAGLLGTLAGVLWRYRGRGGGVMIREFLLLTLGWSPIWILVVWRRGEIRIGRVLFAAALVGFIGGMSALELRRYGALLTPADAVMVLGFCLNDGIRFAFLGAAGAALGEFFLSRSSEKEPV